MSPWSQLHCCEEEGGLRCFSNWNHNTRNPKVLSLITGKRNKMRFGFTSTFVPSNFSAFYLGGDSHNIYEKWVSKGHGELDGFASVYSSLSGPSQANEYRMRSSEKQILCKWNKIFLANRTVNIFSQKCCDSSQHSYHWVVFATYHISPQAWSPSYEVRSYPKSACFQSLWTHSMCNGLD